MADLIAIGYPDEATAALAAQEVEHLAEDLVIEPDHVAVIRRHKKGRFHAEQQVQAALNGHATAAA